MLYHQSDSTCSGELLVVPSTDQFDSHVGQLLTHCCFVSLQTKSNRISKRQTDRGRFSDPRYDHHSVQRPVDSGGGEFGPVRVTDIELQPAPGSTQTRDNRFIYRRFNQTISRATTSTRIDTGTGQRVQSPILWSNRTWHWSTNRTREYDPDLDGTTLPPPIDYFNLTPPPLREPYETRFYPWGSKTTTNEKTGKRDRLSLKIALKNILTQTITSLLTVFLWYSSTLLIIFFIFIQLIISLPGTVFNRYLFPFTSFLPLPITPIHSDIRESTTVSTRLIGTTTSIGEQKINTPFFSFILPFMN